MHSRFKPSNKSFTAPTLPDEMVSRPHVIHTIKRLFDSDTDLVTVEGAPGSGKTTLLREFIEVVDEPCFALFLKPGNRALYSPRLARRELACQLQYYLRGDSLSDGTEWTTGDLRSHWQKCNRKLSRHGSTGFVIVDGIHHIDPQESAIREAIWELLPRHHKYLKILCSAGQNADREFSRIGIKTKPFLIQCFSTHESHEYLKDIVPERATREQFHNQYGGHPASLASLRRQILFLVAQNDNRPLSFPTDANSLLKSEWELTRPSSPGVIKALAALIAVGQPSTYLTLSEQCKLSENQLTDSFAAIPFLKYSVELKTWDFCSNGIRIIASRNLENEVDDVSASISDSYLDDPDSGEALSQLPQYLETNVQSEHLLQWFTEERIADILKREKSVASVLPTLRKAISICKEARQYEGLLAYSLSGSIIRYLSYATSINYEIGARAALGDFQGAMKVVNSVHLLTQRLRLMAVVLHAFSDVQGVQLEPVRAEFEQILSQIDWSALPTEEAISIAEDVYRIDPARSLDILDQVVGTDKGAGSLDMTLARLSLSAIKARASKELSRNSDEHDPIPDHRLIDNKLRQFLDTVSRLLEANSAQEILIAIKEIQDPSQKLFLLRKWLVQNPLRQDAIVITEHAIELAIQSTPYVPNALFYREIASPLPYGEESDRRQEVIRMLDGQNHIIKKRGPTVEYVRLQLQLVQSEWKSGLFNKAIERVSDFYFDTLDPMDQSETLLSCLSWCVSMLSTLDGCNEDQECKEVMALVTDEHDKCLNAILSDSAEQLEIVRGSLHALAVYVPEKAIAIAKRLNTETRRQAAFRVILDAMCRVTHTSLGSPAINSIVQALVDTEHYDPAIFQLTARLCSDVKEGKAKSDEITWIVDFLGKCSSAIPKCRCLASLLALLTCEDSVKDVRTRLEREIVVTFDSLASDTDKYTAACILLMELKGKVDLCQTVVGHVLEFLSELENDRPLDSVTTTGLYYVLDLLVKAARGLAKAGNLKESDIDRVCSLVDSVRDSGLQLTLYSSLAMYLWSADKGESCARITNNYIRPILNSLPKTDPSTTYSNWVDVYPVVWLLNRDWAREGIATFPNWVRERCYASLCYTILRRQPISEPFDDRARNRRIGRTFEDVSNLLQVCKESNSDELISRIFEWIADELTGKNPKQRLTGDQKAEVARKMYDIAEKKLPIATGIRHDGYRIMCQAQALRVCKISGISWRHLISDAQKLENRADRVFVLAHLALYYTNRKKRQTLFDDTERESGELLTLEDRYGRYYAIATIVSEQDRLRARRVIKKAFGELRVGRETGYSEEERNLIDLAYRIDSELPMELAIVYDKDEARKEYYESRAKRQVRSLEMKKNIVNNKMTFEEQGNSKNDKMVASAVWRALASLNAGMIVGVDAARCREMIVRASESPLHIAYPLYSWVLSSLDMKYSGEGSRQGNLRAAFEGVLRGAKLFCSLTRASGTLYEVPDWEDLSMKNGQLMIDAGERTKALQFLESWIKGRAEEYLIIADPYFANTDLELLRSVLKADHEMKVTIVTGCPQENSANGNLVEAFNDAWKNVCEQTPPETEVTVVYISGDPGRRAPFHDRWLLSRGVGLQLGTSYGSFGSRTSTIRHLSDKELQQVYAKIEPYRKGLTRTVDGKKLVYHKFELER